MVKEMREKERCGKGAGMEDDGRKEAQKRGERCRRKTEKVQESKVRGEQEEMRTREREERVCKRARERCGKKAGGSGATARKYA